MLSRCCYVVDTKHTPGKTTKTCGTDDREKIVLCSTSSTEECVRPTSRLGTITGTCSQLRNESGDVTCVETGKTGHDLYNLLIGDPDYMTQTICSDDSAKSHCFCNQTFSIQ